MNDRDVFDVCIIIDMWKLDPYNPRYYLDNEFLEKFVYSFLMHNAPKSKWRICSHRVEPVNDLLWATLPAPTIAWKLPKIEQLEEHNFVKSKQDKICVIGQHWGACVLHSNCGMLDFLLSGYEHVYTDLNLVNPSPRDKSGALTTDDFVEEFDSIKRRIKGKLQFKRVFNSTYKVTILEEYNENTDSRQ